MKTLSSIAIAVVCLAGLSAPALAATHVAASSVPYCTSSVSQHDVNNGTYAWELSKPGLSIRSLDVWGGCLKVIYDDDHGHSTTAFYDPDTLKQVG